MGAYENALMEEGDKNDLKRALVKAWNERDDVRDRAIKAAEELIRFPSKVPVPRDYDGLDIDSFDSGVVRCAQEILKVLRDAAPTS